MYTIRPKKEEIKMKMVVYYVRKFQSIDNDIYILPLFISLFVKTGSWIGHATLD